MALTSAAVILLNLLGGASSGYFARKQEVSAENQAAQKEYMKRAEKFADKINAENEERAKQVYNYNLESVQDASSTTCSQAQVGTATVTVNPSPTATITGTVDVCEGDADPVVTFTGANGTAPYTFTYTVNGGANQTVTSVGATATISQSTATAGTYVYDLVSVEDGSSTACSQGAVQSVREKGGIAC